MARRAASHLVDDALSEQSAFGLSLDLGCGAGNFTESLARGLGVCIGVDTDVSRVPMGARALYVCADASALPFREEAFDRVLTLEVLEHLSAPESALREIARVAKKDATVVVGVPTGYSERLYQFLNPKYMTQATHVRVFSYGSLQSLLERAGFSIEAAAIRNFDWSVKWFFHAGLRSRASADGTILEHLWVSRCVHLVLRAAAHTPGLRTLLRFVELRIGKSRYVVARPKRDVEAQPPG